MKKVLKYFSILAAVIVTYFVALPALAARTVKVPAIEIQKTGYYAGQYMTIYYAFEKPLIIRTERDHLALAQIQATATQKISGDSVFFGAVELKKEGIRGAYDTIVVVISPSNQFVWKNEDQTIPLGLADTKVYQSSFISYKKVYEFDRHINSFNESTTFVWPLF